MMQLATPSDFRRQRLAQAGLQKQERLTLHPCICDRCGGLVQGIRFKCLVCPDFDLCAACLQKGRPVMGKGSHAEVGQTHEDSHEMLLLPRATSNSTVACLVGAWQNGKRNLGASTVSEATATACKFGCSPSAEGIEAFCSCGQKLCRRCLRCCDSPGLWLPGPEPTSRARAQQLGKQWQLATPEVEEVMEESIAEDCGIRLMARDDLDAVLAVENISFVQPYSRDTFEIILGHDGYISFVAVSTSGRCAGYLILELGGDPKQPGYPCYVMSLAVLPCFRSHGVAQQLLQEALCEARRHHSPAVELHVHTRNEGAIKLYRRCGFDVLEEVRGFYGSGDLQSGDAYVMRCLLKA